MGLSIWQILLVAVLAILLFGRGRISDLMGDVAKGIKSFKKGMAEDEDEESKPQDPKVIDQKPEDVVSEKTSEKSENK